MIDGSALDTSGEEISLKLLTRLWKIISPDRRPDHEKAREREFIKAANSLRTLRVTPEGGMFIDPAELSDQIAAAREELKHLVHRTGSPNTPSKHEMSSDFGIAIEPSPASCRDDFDCIEVIVWRRAASGTSVRYACLQSLATGQYAVVLVSEIDHLPPWAACHPSRQIARALRTSDLRWFESIGAAIDGWEKC